jgi:hypothetical protein
LGSHKDLVQTNENQAKKSSLERKPKNDEAKYVDCRLGDASNDCGAAVVSGITERHGK